ncbi:MAG: CZB domain-containing protein [Sulfuricurvum sp.]|nr:CZB domain-containing protein [Sulfuricurvum sp.]
MDHIIIKANAYSAIFHGKIGEEFEDHHSCRLGRWYENGLGKERFSKLPGYNALLQPHQTIHNTIKANMKFIEKGDFVTENKEKVIANFQAMEEASDTLFTAIDALLLESAKL